jgi:hypothetical protein
MVGILWMGCVNVNFNWVMVIPVKIRRENETFKVHNSGLQNIRFGAEEVPNPTQKYVLAPVFSKVKMNQVNISVAMVHLLSM